MAKLDQGSITQAALVVIDDDERELTLASVARELEVTQPALYYHVDGIDDLWRWIGLEVRSELVVALTNATIGRSPSHAVRAVADAWRLYSQENPARYQSTNWHPVEGCEELEAAVGEVLAVLAGSLRSYGLSDDDRAPCTDLCPSSSARAIRRRSPPTSRSFTLWSCSSPASKHSLQGRYRAWHLDPEQYQRR